MNLLFRELILKVCRNRNKKKKKTSEEGGEAENRSERMRKKLSRAVLLISWGRSWDSVHLRV